MEGGREAVWKVAAVRWSLSEGDQCGEHGRRVYGERKESSAL